MTNFDIRTVLNETRNVYLEIIPEFFETHEFEIATIEEIQDFEKKIGVTFPEDLQEFLLNCNFELQINANFYTQSFEFMKDIWESWTKFLDNGAFKGKLQEPDLGDNFGMEQKIIKQNWWNNKWIPFAEDGGGNLICIDLDPAENGTNGQIVQIETATGPYFEGSISITEFCTKQLELIKNNKYTIDSGSFYIDQDS